MNKLLIGVWLCLVTTLSYAACSTQTVTMGGRMTVCTTCCDAYNNCNTTCF